MMIAFLTGATCYKLFSMVGVSIAVLGAIITAFAYHGKDGEHYSPLNHFISELGEVGVSRLAWVFNLGLMLNGLCLIPACISLGLLLPGILPKIGIVLGVVCALGLFFVGVFPMNKIEPHSKAALIYFRGALAMVIVFSLAIALPPESNLALPRWFGLAGLPVILAFSGFLIQMRLTAADVDDPLSVEEGERLKILPLAFLEWLTFLMIVLWIWVISLSL